MSHHRTGKGENIYVGRLFFLFYINILDDGHQPGVIHYNIFLALRVGGIWIFRLHITQTSTNKKFALNISEMLLLRNKIWLN